MPSGFNKVHPAGRNIDVGWQPSMLAPDALNLTRELIEASGKLRGQRFG